MVNTTVSVETPPNDDENLPDEGVEFFIKQKNNKPDHSINVDVINNFLKEFFTCYNIIGYDRYDNRVFISNTETQRDQDAMENFVNELYIGNATDGKFHFTDITFEEE